MKEYKPNGITLEIEMKISDRVDKTHEITVRQN
jgi:hypothetical protein